MPLEGHWERQHTPLRRTPPRERRVLLVAGGLIALATVVVLVVALTSSGPAPRAGCIDVTAASTTGGATFRACGADAQRRCAAVRPGGDGGLARACRRAGLPVAG
jgi:hypothetical protein